MDLLTLLSTGLLDLSIGTLVAVTLVLTHVTVVAVTVYLHRYSAHRALELHPAVQHFFRLWLWLATGMTTKAWTAVHRKHHALCETDEDPHSPQIMGIGEIFWCQTEAYQRSAAQREVLDQYGSGTPDDWLERNLYGRFSYLGIVLMLAIDVLLFGVLGITVWAVQMIWIPLLGGVINGVGHYWGYRNFECADASRNIVPWGILIGGEELHNNHHTYPNSAKLAVKPWELDLGWMWICLLRRLGLARPLVTGPVVTRGEEPTELGKDTATALVNDRFNVMARYANDVIGPTVKAYKNSIEGSPGRMLARAKQLMCRSEILLDAAARQRLSQLIEVPEFRTVYDLRIKLQAIWDQRGGSMDELALALRQWCADAEATGSQVLFEFVRDLKCYALPRAAAA